MVRSDECDVETWGIAGEATEAFQEVSAEITHFGHSTAKALVYEAQRRQAHQAPQGDSPGAAARAEATKPPALLSRGNRNRVALRIGQV